MPVVVAAASLVLVMPSYYVMHVPNMSLLHMILLFSTVQIEGLHVLLLSYYSILFSFSLGFTVSRVISEHISEEKNACAQQL